MTAGRGADDGGVCWDESTCAFTDREEAEYDWSVEGENPGDVRCGDRR